MKISLGPGGVALLNLVFYEISHNIMTNISEPFIDISNLSSHFLEMETYILNICSTAKDFITENIQILHHVIPRQTRKDIGTVSAST